MFSGRVGQGKRGTDKRPRKRRTKAEIERDRRRDAALPTPPAKKRIVAVQLTDTVDLTSPTPSPCPTRAKYDTPTIVAIDLTSPEKERVIKTDADATAKKLVRGTPGTCAVAPIFTALATSGVSKRRVPRPPRVPLSTDQVTLNKSRAGIASGIARKAAGIAKRKRAVRDLMVGIPCYCSLKTVRREKFDDHAPYWGCVKGRRGTGGCGFYTARSDQQSPVPQSIQGKDFL